MNGLDLGLEDIITPDGVSFWPPAFGWWILVGLIVLGSMLVIYGVRRYKKKWTYRNQALAILKEQLKQWQENKNDLQASQSMLSTLKRVAVSAYPDEKTIPSLYGASWLTFLNGQTKKPVFIEDSANTIITGQYQAKTDIDIGLFYESCRRWIKQHKVNAEVIL